jgi:hypothetical protein
MVTVPSVPRSHLFEPPQAYPIGTSETQAFTFTVGDINSDGKPDLLVDNYLDNVNGPQFLVLFGNGDGTFQPPETIALPPNQSAELGIVVGDFDRDGLLDLNFLYSLGMYSFLQQ